MNLRVPARLLPPLTTRKIDLQFPLPRPKKYQHPRKYLFCAHTFIGLLTGKVASFTRCKYSRAMMNPSQGFDPSHPSIGTLLRLVFAWAFVWSVGANIDDASRPKLEKWAGDRFRSLVGSGSPFLKVHKEIKSISRRRLDASGRIHACS